MSLNADIAAHVTQWRTQVKHLATPEAEFGKWLFVRAAGVLFGNKAGELLNLAPGRCALSVQRQLEQVDHLTGSWHCSYQVLYQAPRSTKLIVYDQERVVRCLAQVPACILYEALAYPRGLDAERFVAEVARRWAESGRIPHEIGVALGYPVKDVLGYMGLLPLQCKGCCGWQIYGDTEMAHRMRRQFVAAQSRARALLANGVDGRPAPEPEPE